MNSFYNTNKDFVYTTDKNGLFQSGGFKLDSSILGDLNAITTLEISDDGVIQHGGANSSNKKTSTPIKNSDELVIPAGLFMIQRFSVHNLKDNNDEQDENNSNEDNITPKHTIEYKDGDVIHNDLYTQLYALVNVNSDSNTSEQENTNEVSSINKQSSKKKTKKNKKQLKTSNKKTRKA